ncbi:MAG: acyl-ACP--UDP-N-acetylglucosamine O-acyltransferase [Gammaproteobacteria bacterium]|nr:acyl-ACP--UDP-N-acetylglucosamine O-acyltransferase [Gammaproteobacteria bacterium]
MSRIHPTAIVADSANVAEDVEVGPYAVIGDDVVIGSGTWIGAHASIVGPTTIGCNNKIYQFCSIGGDTQHTAKQTRVSTLSIGDGNTFREFCTINRGSDQGTNKTVIGNNNFLMAYVHVAHDCVIGNNVTFANNASLAGHVEVEDYAILGGFTGIHQFCRVGSHVMTGIATISFKDIPPYLMVSGNTAQPFGLNTRGLKRRGFTEDDIKALKTAYKTLYRSGLTQDKALGELADLADKYPDVGHFVEFIKKTERGIIR